MSEKPFDKQLILIAKLLVPVAYILLGWYILQHQDIKDLGKMAGIKVTVWFSYLLIIYGAFRAWRIYVATKSNEKE